MSVKGQGHSLTLVKGHSHFKVKTCFSQKTVGQFWNQNSYQSLRGMGMKIHTNELGYMTNMAAMPICGKNLKKYSSPEAIDR